jgi:hypothetical protein
MLRRQIKEGFPVTFLGRLSEFLTAVRNSPNRNSWLSLEWHERCLKNDAHAWAIPPPWGRLGWRPLCFSTYMGTAPLLLQPR